MVRAIPRGEVTKQLTALGVEPGSVLLVHTAFSTVAPVEGGPRGLIKALRDALGREGTLVMPSLPDHRDRPFHVGESQCLGVGIVADTFWRMRGVRRSDNPHAFAAVGPRAAEIVAPHPIDVPHGLDTPVGRVYELDGHVLLLGVDQRANASVHIAEKLAGVKYRRFKYLTVLIAGEPQRYAYGETDHCCENFSLLDQWLAEAGRLRRGAVGYGEARLARSRDIVGFALGRLKQDETVFLHPAGQCQQCDEARQSLAERPMV